MKNLSYIFFAIFVLALQIFFVDRMWSGIFFSVYLSIILLADVRMPRWSLLLLAFFVGGIVDIASAGCGLNAAVSVFLALLKTPLAELTLPSGFMENGGPVTTFDVNPKIFFKYLCLAFAIWSIIFFTLESGFSSPLAILARTVANTAIGPAIVFLLQLLIRH